MAKRTDSSKKAFVSEDDWVQVKVDIATIKKDVSYIRRALDGNGNPGLIRRVDKLEQGVSKVLAGAAILGTVAGIAITVLLHFI